MQLLQLTLDGVATGGRYALLGLGLALIVRVTGRFHIAFGACIALGAYVTWSLSESLGMPLAVAVAGGAVAAAAFGAAAEWLLYRHVVRRVHAGDELTAIFVSSLGLLIVAQNVIKLAWGPDTLSLGSIIPVPVSVGSGVISNIDLITCGAALALVVGTELFLQATPWGQRVTAVRVNPDLARVVGIDSGHVYVAVLAAGSALAGLVGAATLARTGATAEMGAAPTFTGFVVAFVAGFSGRPIFVGLAGLAIGLIESLSGLVLDTKWHSLVVFALVFAFLALLPFARGRSLRPRLRRRVVEGATA